MRILIVGASGLVGGNCLKHFREQQSSDVVGTYFSHNAQDTVYYNTLNPEDQRNFNIDEFQPQVIVHCGALTWVDHCEEHPEKSHQHTVASTENIIKLCNKYHSKMVYLSTDYVFDGESGPYDESAHPNPVNVYGQHKLEAEQRIQEALSNFLILRITNVYGHEERGKNFVARLLHNAQKGEQQHLKLPIDQYATPVNAYDIARMIYLLLKGSKNGIYHVGGTDYYNRFQLASRVLQYAPDHQMTLEAVSTTDLNQAAQRPLRGGFVNSKFIEEYPDFTFSNVDDFLNDLISAS